MIKISDEIREKLREPFPPEAISQHPTKTFLSTIKAIYITERLNDVFGIGGWNLEHEIVSDTDDYVSVCGYIEVGDPFNLITPKQYGGHKKTGTNTEPADGYKSAVTDCQSKCASYLEVGIDVFKGLVSPTGKPAKKADPKQYASHKPKTDGNTGMSPAQRKFIKTIGEKDCGLSEVDIVGLVKWKAEQMKVDANHYSVARAFLGDSKNGDVPKEVFSAVLLEWESSQEQMADSMESLAADEATREREGALV